MQDIITKIMDEIRSNELDKGYRAMHQTLTRIGFAVDKDSVRLGLKELDPVGVALISFPAKVAIYFRYVFLILGKVL